MENKKNLTRVELYKDYRHEIEHVLFKGKKENKIEQNYVKNEVHAKENKNEFLEFFKKYKSQKKKKAIIYIAISVVVSLLLIGLIIYLGIKYLWNTFQLQSMDQAQVESLL